MLRDAENNLIGPGDRLKHEKGDFEGTFEESLVRNGRRTVVVLAPDGARHEAPPWLLVRTEATEPTKKAERLRALKMRHKYGK